MVGVHIWQEAAALVRDAPSGDYPRELVREGPLWEVLLYVDKLDDDAQRALVVALPDRRAPPLRLGHEDILTLLRRYDRPRFGGLR